MRTEREESTDKQISINDNIIRYLEIHHIPPKAIELLITAINKEA